MFAGTVSPPTCEGPVIHSIALYAGGETGSCRRLHHPDQIHDVPTLCSPLFAPFPVLE